jgi:YHS domain-containing protein
MMSGHNLTAWCLALLCAASAASFAGDAHSDGIWKAAVPRTPMQGEFDSLDPLGIAAGARIKADCSLNWINPDNGKRYCFSSGTSLEFFLDKPQANLARAQAGWRQMTSQKK